MSKCLHVYIAPFSSSYNSQGDSCNFITQFNLYVPVLVEQIKKKICELTFKVHINCQGKNDEMNTTPTLILEATRSIPILWFSGQRQARSIYQLV